MWLLLPALLLVVAPAIQASAASRDPQGGRGRRQEGSAHTIEVEKLRSAFQEMRSLDVTIEDVRVLASDGVMARVSCRVTQTLTPKAGPKQKTAVTRVMRLRRQPTSWIIENFER